MRNRLSHVLERLVISICEPRLRQSSSKGWITQEDNTYKKDSNGFFNKTNDNDIPVGSLLVTADGKGLYPSILHEVSLKGLKRAFEERKEKNISYENLAKMGETFLKQYFFELTAMSLSHLLIAGNPRIERKVGF